MEAVELEVPRSNEMPVLAPYFACKFDCLIPAWRVVFAAPEPAVEVFAKPIFICNDRYLIIINPLPHG